MQYMQYISYISYISYMFEIILISSNFKKQRIQIKTVKMKQHKHRNFIILPPPEERFKSLKASHAHFHKPPQLTKRQSLDFKPILQMRKQPTLENIQDIIFTNQGTKLYYNKTKPLFQVSNKEKYYCKKKQGKQARSYKVKASSVKRTWSEVYKNTDIKNRNSYYSRSRNDQNCKINLSDCFDNKNEFLNKISNHSGHTSKSNHSKGEIKKAKSLLNSTMLTKRESEEKKESKEDKYEHLIFKLKDVLSKYQIKVIQLKEQRDYYRSKYKKTIKRQL